MSDRWFHRSALRGRLGTAQKLLLCGFILILAGCNKPSMVKEWEVASDLKEQAEAGDVQAQYRLGMNYTNGRGVLRNHETAVMWFDKAAGAGHVDAQFMLGAALASGRGIPKDQQASVDWFHKAANAGHMRAQYQLGDIYLNGRTVKRDRAWGARWYGMAASQGHKQAQFLLGALYSKGIGVPKSTARAVFWLKRAELSGHEKAAKALANLRKQVSSKSYGTYSERAERWVPAKTMMGLNNRPTLVYVQHVLNQLNYTAGFPDGIRGPKTDSAITQYRVDRGINGAKGMGAVVTALRKDSESMDVE